MRKRKSKNVGSSSNNRTNVQKPDPSIQSVSAKGGAVVSNTQVSKGINDPPQWSSSVLPRLKVFSFAVTLLSLGCGFVIIVNDLKNEKMEVVQCFFNAFLVLAFFLCLGIGSFLYYRYENKESLILTFFPTSWKHERTPTYLLFFTVAVIIAACILKANYKTSPIVESGVADGVIGVVASCCAAIVLQLLETWQRIRDRLRERNELLEFLGVDHNLFSPADQERCLTIAIPMYPPPPPNIDSGCQPGGIPIPGDLYGTFGYSGTGVDKLCATEDVQAYRYIQNLLRRYDIPSKLACPQKITEDTKLFKDDDGANSPSVQGNYICIGILTNRLARACFHHDLKKSRSGVHHLDLNDNEPRFVRDRQFTESGAQYGLIYRWVQDDGTSRNSIFILGGIGAAQTERTGEYFSKHWKDLLKKFKDVKDRPDRWSILENLEDRF